MIDRVNIIINCASVVDFETDLGSQIETNVSGVLNLIKFSEECNNVEIFT
jgi:hypothetical protein